jgi:hypothetical protein
MPRVEPGSFFAGVRSPPLRGDAPQYRRFHGDKPGDRAKGGFLGGARSPRPRWKAARKPGYGMAEESPETMREAVFSEGRTLCVRLARLDVNRGRSWLGTSWREASGLAGACEAEANGFIAGVRSPPLQGDIPPI